MHYTISKEYRTETGHRLLNYDGKCAHLHGHSYLWRVSLRATTLDALDMVADFGVLKKALKEVLEPLDHAMVLHKEDPLADVLSNARAHMPLLHTQPKMRVHLWDWNPTAEVFARYCGTQVRDYLEQRQEQQMLADGIWVGQVEVWETETSCATWEG